MYQRVMCCEEIAYFDVEMNLLLMQKDVCLCFTYREHDGKFKVWEVFCFFYQYSLLT